MPQQLKRLVLVFALILGGLFCFYSSTRCLSTYAVRSQKV